MTKKFGFILAGLLCTSSLAQAVTIELDAGTLRTALGTTTVPAGALLQIIAVRTGAAGAFAVPTPTSFLGGDTTNELIVASFAMNNVFGNGESDNVFTFNLENTGTASASTFDQGDALLLRWWPTLTLASTSPGANTTFGQYRSNTPETLSNGTSAGIAWFAPASTAQLGAPNGLNFLTTDITSGPPTGTNAPAVGFANLRTAVPEPSTFALLGGALGLAGFWMLRQPTDRR